MKRVISIIAVLCVLASAMSVFAANTEIIIDGKNATIADGMGSIAEKDDRTFVPIRFLLEYFNYTVVWSDETQMVTGKNADSGEMFVMQVDNKNLFFFDALGNKEIVEMDVAPYLNNAEGRTYVPLRFIAQAIGYNVGWDDATKTVTLTKK